MREAYRSNTIQQLPTILWQLRGRIFFRMRRLHFRMVLCILPSAHFVQVVIARDNVMKYLLNLICGLLLAVGAEMAAVAEVTKEDILARAAKCPLPEIPHDAEIVFLGLGHGTLTANLTLDRPNRPMFVADVMIEESEKPLYLIMSSHGIGVFRFFGAVDRLARVASVSFWPTGFASIDPNRIFWFERRECQILGWRPNDKLWGPDDWWGPKLQLEYVKALAGRPIDRIIVKNTVGFISVPGGEVLTRAKIPEQIEPEMEGKNAAIWKVLLSNFPDGVVNLREDEVFTLQKLHVLEYLDDQK